MKSTVTQSVSGLLALGSVYLQYWLTPQHEWTKHLFLDSQNGIVHLLETSLYHPSAHLFYYWPPYFNGLFYPLLFPLKTIVLYTIASKNRNYIAKCKGFLNSILGISAMLFSIVKLTLDSYRWSIILYLYSFALIAKQIYLSQTWRVNITKMDWFNFHFYYSHVFSI